MSDYFTFSSHVYVFFIILATIWFAYFTCTNGSYDMANFSLKKCVNIGSFKNEETDTDDDTDDDTEDDTEDDTGNDFYTGGSSDIIRDARDYQSIINNKNICGVDYYEYSKILDKSTAKIASLAGKRCNAIKDKASCAGICTKKNETTVECDKMSKEDCDETTGDSKDCEWDTSSTSELFTKFEQGDISYWNFNSDYKKIKSEELCRWFNDSTEVEDNKVTGIERIEGDGEFSDLMRDNVYVPYYINEDLQAFIRKDGESHKDKLDLAIRSCDDINKKLFNNNENSVNRNCMGIGLRRFDDFNIEGDNVNKPPFGGSYTGHGGGLNFFAISGSYLGQGKSLYCDKDHEDPNSTRNCLKHLKNGETKHKVTSSDEIITVLKKSDNYSLYLEKEMTGSDKQKKVWENLQTYDYGLTEGRRKSMVEQQKLMMLQDALCECRKSKTCRYVGMDPINPVNFHLLGTNPIKPGGGSAELMSLLNYDTGYFIDVNHRDGMFVGGVSGHAGNECVKKDDGEFEKNCIITGHGYCVGNYFTGYL